MAASQNFSQSVCATIIIAFIVAQAASLETSCPGGVNSKPHVEAASLKAGWMYSIQSPDFPGKYTPNTSCSWTFTAPKHYEFLIIFKHFQLEPSKQCQSDYLQISFTNHSVQNWRKYCSVASDNYINTLHLKRIKHYIPSENINIEFKSDGSFEYKGFAGEVRLVAPVIGPLPPDRNEEYCDNYLNDTSGSFTTPKHPHPYPVNMSCTWNLAVPSGKKVHLKFTFFDLENKLNKDGDCANDYVEIREGVWGRRGGIILGRFCYNGTIPPQVISPSSQMWVRFVSNDDPSNEHKGFYAQFADTDSSGSRCSPSFISICFGVLFVLIWL